MASSPIFMLFQGRKGKIGSLLIEATMSENYSFSATPTKFPIEDGSIVSDHIITEPEKIRIDGFVSNTPPGSAPDNYAQQAFDLLHEMWQAKALVTVDTKFFIYDDMCITDINIPRNQQTGQAIYFSVELQKIKKVGSSASDDEKYPVDTKLQITTLKPLGQAIANAVPEPIQEFVSRGIEFAKQYFNNLINDLVST